MKPMTLVVALLMLLSTNLSAQTPAACDTALAGITTNISLSGSCILHLDSTMADELISNYSASLSYEVTIFDATGTDTVDSPLRSEAIGETYMVKIVAKDCPDSLMREAWSTVRIEDYTAPRLTCTTDTMNCQDFALSPIAGIDECDTFSVDILALSYENACDSLMLSGISTIATRTYRVTDASGNSSQCTDTTYIRRVEFDSIAFPRDTLLACSARDSFFDSNGDLIAPSLLLEVGDGTLNDQYVFGVPTLNGASLYSGRFRGCRTRAYYEDFFVDSIKRYCEYTYMRRWTAYEWYCDEELSESMVQNITFKDTINPTVDILVDTLYFDITTASCQISIPVDSLRQYIDASDNCTPVDLLEIDYTYPVRLSSASDSVIVLQDADTFLVQITIKDKCGKEVQDSLYMVATDRYAPVALCEGSINISISNANTNPVDINMLNRGSYDDCGSVTLSARKMQDTAYANHHLNFGCIDRDEEELAAILRVTDERGNVDECMTMINLTVDTSAVDCDTVAATSPIISTATVYGAIRYVDDSPVGGIPVSISSADMAETTMTDLDGYYEVPDVLFSSAVDIIPHKNDHPAHGISTLDLLLMQRHILGIEDLPTAYQVIAGDANVDGRLSVHDIVELRQLILGRTLALAHTDSYRFVPADMDFQEPMDPWAEGVVFGKTVKSSSGPTMTQDFVAVKIGDVDLSLLSAKTRSSEALVLEYEIIPMGSQYFEMNIKVPNKISVDGLQGAISFDPQLMRLMKVGQGALPLSSEHYSIDQAADGQIYLSWSDIHTSVLESGETMMSFIFERFADIDPTFSLGEHMDAELYGDDMIYPLILSRENHVSDDFALSRNVPNPWSDETRVEFSIPQSAPVTINVYDMSMTKLYSNQKNCQAGFNSFKIKNENLPNQGVYFYEIVYAGQVRVSKMTRL